MKKFRENIWIYSILSAFFLVIMVNVFYIFLASKTWRGIISQDAYRIGINYNKVLQQQKWQKALQIMLLSHYDPKSKILFLQLKDSQKNPILGAKIEVKFKRMLNQKLDFSAQLSQVNQQSNNNYQSKINQNQYQAKIDFPKKGKWQAQYLIELPPSFQKSAKDLNNHQNQAQPLIYLDSEEFFIR